MGFLKDIFSIFKKSELIFLEKYEEVDGVYSFLFEKDKNLDWNAGQHGLFTITHKKLKDSTRPFSIASSPTEDMVRITTRISDKPSEFKKALLELEKGMKISMSGPVGSFYMRVNSPSLFIAAGIGITPFRSIIKQIETKAKIDSDQVKLLYLDSNNSFIYKEELDEIAGNTSIEITYLDSKSELNQEIDTFISSYINEAKYYIAGSKAMVGTITNHLKEHNISKRNIKKDSFFGV